MSICKCRNAGLTGLFSLGLCLVMAVFPLFATEHIVQKGETLYSISRTYGLSLEAIRKANQLDSSSVLKSGQKLFIPDLSSQTYTVQKGDTLYSIARTNNMTVEELRKANNLSESSAIKAGQVLAITGTTPVSAGTAQSAAAALSTTVSTPSAAPTPGKSATVTASTAVSQLRWPVQQPTVTYMNGKIIGVQLSAKENENVAAINHGIVLYSGIYRGFGNVVFVLNPAGYMYVYTDLGRLNVTTGSQVKSGDILGTAGVDAATGKSQLTLMVYQNNKPIDPAIAPRS
jgi:LysM repeat protein